MAPQTRFAAPPIQKGRAQAPASLLCATALNTTRVLNMQEIAASSPNLPPKKSAYDSPLPQPFVQA